MSPWLRTSILEPRLPEYCQPTSEFLRLFSSTFHTCVPTPLAFLSTLLGILSIVSWLFAQLPQIYKNYRLSSTSGLSIFFLAEWCLGDLSNLLGAIFTKQAAWQVVVAGYYCFVDAALIVQWIWYEQIRPGRPLIRLVRSRSRPTGDDDESADDSSVSGTTVAAIENKNSSTQDIYRSSPQNVFHNPWISSSPSSSKEVYSSLGTTPTPSPRTIYRQLHSTSPLPSPKTLLYVSLILSLAANASPLSLPSSLPSEPPISPTSTPSETAGRLLSWLSTLLYLGSRLPQLYKNALRRSTAGLSLSLFVAAFFGNLFYSSSLLANPCAWASYPPHGAHGWIGPDGSDRAEWLGRAAPFWLGAAGVLIMDALVGVQFWYFGAARERDGVDDVVAASVSTQGDAGLGGGAGSAARVPGVRQPGESVKIPVRPGLWQRRVSGWMRGWVPSVSDVVSSFSPPRSAAGKLRGGAESEAEALLGKRKKKVRRAYGGV